MAERVHVACLDKLNHLTEEEREEQRSDVSTVHVGVGHDHDFVVTGVAEVELITDARPDRGDDRADLLVPKDPVDPRPLHVEDLAL